MKLPSHSDLKTLRLTLRPVALEDVPALFGYMVDPEVSRWMAWEPHESLAQTEGFVAHEVGRRETGRGITWAILEQDALCGIFSLIGLMGSHRALTYNRAEAAYWLGSAHRRRGLATEAGQAVLRFGFGPVGLHKVHVSHFAANDASRFLIKRLGFRHVGVQRKEFRKDGIWHDHHLYELLSEEFAARNRLDES